MSWLSQTVRKFTETSLLFRVGAICLLLGFLMGGITCRAWRKAIIEEPPQVAHGFGWLDEPDEVKRLLATFPNPFFGDAGKNLVMAEEDRDAFLWQAWEKVNKRPWRAHDQNGTGCCVGEGFSGALEVLQAVEILINRERQEYKDISASVCYGLSREASGHKFRGDGSTGAGAAKALMEYGSVSCEDAGDDNFTNPQHAQTAKKFGTKVPNDLKVLAAKRKLKNASQVRTPEEVRSALVNGYPVAICSSVGFEPFKRDKNGFCRSGGTWPHCMFIAGYRKDMKAFLVIQSWGESMPPGPKTLDQPDCSFWISWQDCQRIVRSGESYALSAFDGFPARNVDVFIRGNQEPRDAVAKVRDLRQWFMSLAF